MREVPGEEIPGRAQWPLTRRAFVEYAAAVAGVGAVLPAVPAFASAEAPAAAPAKVVAARAPVVSFHLDRPYLDPTGLAEPYIPPAGTRSGQPLAELSEEEFLSRHPY